MSATDYETNRIKKTEKKATNGLEAEDSGGNSSSARRHIGDRWPGGELQRRPGAEREVAL